MDERMMQFRIGAVVLATILLGGIMVLLFGETPALVRDTYTIYIHFPSAPGVSRDTPVRKSGILIGRVTNVAFVDPDDNDDAEGVIVTVAIDADMKIRMNEIPRITRSVLGGDATIDFFRSPDPDASRKEVVPGQLVAGIAGADPLQVIGNLEGELTEAMRSISFTSDEIGGLVRRVNDMLAANDEQFARILDTTEYTMVDLRTAVGNFNDIFGDDESRARLRQAIADAPELIREVRDVFTELRGTVDLADENLANLRGFTEPLGAQGEELVTRVNSTVDKLDRLMEDLLQFSGRLSSPQGTIGQLLENPELYQNLNQAAENVACLTRELKPILDDVRVISDKIARHPEDLGVRGLISGRRSGIK